MSDKKGRCERIICENVDTPCKGGNKVISYLSPEETRALLQAAEASYLDAAPMYVLALFAGTCGPWRRQALRHSHASYAIAAGTPLESLLFEFGHVGGVEMLRKHYLGRASKAQAAAFFAIGPKEQTLTTTPSP